MMLQSVLYEYYVVFIWDVLYYLTEEIVQLIDKKVDVKNDKCLYVHTGAGRLLRCGACFIAFHPNS